MADETDTAAEALTGCSAWLADARRRRERVARRLAECDTEVREAERQREIAERHAADELVNDVIEYLERMAAARDRDL